MLNQLKPFYHKCIRVWHVMKKPTKKEFSTIAKVAAVGIAIVGLVGFLISIAMDILVLT